MWLLSTNRAELQYFSSADVVDGGYAILSHTWDGHEQTFQEVRDIGARCRRNGTSPREDPGLSSKIRQSCIIAEKHGYRWVWIDSCCIDKTSSSELSEAINSMFQWYSQAEICYAYLADVPSDCILDAHFSSFRQSRWHTRGWTLQELIAPAFLIFLSADWRELGNKTTLAKLLRRITGISRRVLTRRSRPAEFSVATRMSWASKRKTTRVEDEAYCLMGLFGVSMPTNYGEGKKAFARLQYAIMLQSLDTSLFAFGSYLPCGDISQWGITLHPQRGLTYPPRYLLASSPQQLDKVFHYVPDFGLSTNQRYPPLDTEISASAGPFDRMELPRLMVTNYGVELRLPVFEADGVTIAVLLCNDGRDHFGLFMHRDSKGKDPTRPRYYIGCVCVQEGYEHQFVFRMANLGDDLYNLRFNGKSVQAKWATIYVVPGSLDTDSRSAPTVNLMMNCTPDPLFRIPHWLLSRLARVQFIAFEHQRSEALTTIRFYNPDPAIHSFHVLLGSCQEHRDPKDPPSRWAKIIIAERTTTRDRAHDCAEDHVESWAAPSKEFQSASTSEAAVRLSFTSCKRTPENRTLVVHIELFGRVYEEMLREANVSLPSFANLEGGPPPPPAAHVFNPPYLSRSLTANLHPLAVLRPLIPRHLLSR